MSERQRKSYARRRPIRRDRFVFNCRLPLALLDALRAASDREGVSQVVIVEQALERELERRRTEQP